MYGPPNWPGGKLMLCTTSSEISSLSWRTSQCGEGTFLARRYQP
ncbi:Uncharacterised protein [Vibrio cholerae]|nr:Uncharacterised protein [Vibrio cholerae]CSI55974.1 Uncharacterised protein [Vibrio cholerae]